MKNKSKCISNGSYGKIYLIDNNTVIKKSKKFISEKKYYVQNIQEIIFLSLVKHKNIVNVNNIYLNNKINIELEKGDMTLFEYINKTNKKLRMNNFKFIFFQLTQVLYFLHKNNFIHGDIKPNNIIINVKNMIIKLIDFGGICSFRINDNHKPICTPTFCPPEGWPQLNINHISTNFDVWSLAVTMYYYINKEYLLDFKDDRTIDYINEFKPKMKLQKHYHHDIDKIKNMIDENSFNIMKKMLMYDPDDRITIDELYYDSLFFEYEKDIIQKIKYVSEFDASFMSNYTNNEWTQRNKLIEWLYLYCKNNNILNYFVLAIWIIDKYLNIKKIKISSKKIKLYAGAGLIITSIVLADKIINCDDIIQYLPKYVKSNNLIALVDDIMVKLKFQLYIHTFDYIIKDKKVNIDYNDICVFVSKKKYVGLDHYFLADLFIDTI